MFSLQIKKKTHLLLGISASFCTLKQAETFSIKSANNLSAIPGSRRVNLFNSLVRIDFIQLLLISSIYLRKMLVTECGLWESQQKSQE